MHNLLEKVYQTNSLTKVEIIYLLENITPEDREILYSHALKTKQKYYGNKVFLRGLIEFSNICRQDCLYCGIRASNAKVERYRLTPGEILGCCDIGYDLGYRTFVLQSGEDLWYTAEILGALIQEIKKRYPEVAITLSIGERRVETYQSLFASGADRFLMRHETASKDLYEKLHPTMHFEDRQACLSTLKDIGYQVGAGFMVGLPGQTFADLAEDLRYLSEISPDMIGIGPFIPHSETPLGTEKGGTLEDTLVMVALARLLIPGSLIPATTALGTLNPQGRELALKAGANVLMPIITPTSVRKQYALYENKICGDDKPEDCRYCIERRIQAAGFEMDLGRGDSWQFSS
ncbi:[FeFe] hydrogenase H-cluster radical SAM maturase HydE [Desulfosporosinus fructosivorans]|uniref:[FeFe] hydrogenase H-cluster radical SAM maturase HydE n=1 Tax=Desulfosporosinus fructosivorans TaxID=2018669 RepID=A0A4Z0R5Z0_9FIRM|nr:[FeFe] hydrogenase H-cluster radical SAM maturase HydE [Desulfosporosinus fructosivorans]TGE38238.1 [FeFe] hydrogenase H-cluster radical SAM maturase HydE [Desulfosporosinus fructosivorans]